MTGNYRLIIFDWDGTLMDSVGRIVSCMQKAAMECDLPTPSTEQVKEIIGLSLREAMPQLFVAVTESQIEALIARYREHYLYLDETPTPLFPGVASVISSLHAQGYVLAVATGKARAGLDRVLQETGLRAFFHASRGADEARSKPDPLMLEQLLAELDIPLDQAVMVGDSIHDMAMAERLGMARIGISWGVHSAERLARYQPRAVIDSLTLLPALLA
ncbi:MAG: HAD family hydrolase [Aeromonadaceae bacterium]